MRPTTFAQNVCIFFGIGANLPERQEIQCLTYAKFSLIQPLCQFIIGIATLVYVWMCQSLQLTTVFALTNTIFALNPIVFAQNTTLIT